MNNQYGVNVIKVITGDSRFVYFGNDKDRALKIYDKEIKEPDVEVEFYKNGELKFWHESEGDESKWC